MIERQGDRWSEPQPLPPIVNRYGHHWQFSVANNGNLYFVSRLSTAETEGVYCSRFVGGEYTEPEFLGFGGQRPISRRMKAT